MQKRVLDFGFCTEKSATFPVCPGLWRWCGDRFRPLMRSRFMPEYSALQMPGCQLFAQPARLRPANGRVKGRKHGIYMRQTGGLGCVNSRFARCSLPVCGSGRNGCAVQPGAFQAANGNDYVHFAHLSSYRGGFFLLLLHRFSLPQRPPRLCSDATWLRRVRRLKRRKPKIIILK